MGVTISVATEKDKELFKNICNIYMNERSTYIKNSEKVDDNGYFLANPTEKYFTDNKNIVPYIIRKDGSPAGILVFEKLPFVQRSSDYAILELFLLNAYRGKNVSMDVMNEIFVNYHGTYEVRIHKANESGVNFWYKVISKCGTFISEEDYSDEELAIRVMVV